MHQMGVELDTSFKLSEPKTKIIESIAGSFLYYRITVDQTILTALNEIDMQQSKPIHQIKEKATILLDYLATRSNDVLRYYASDISLQIDTESCIFGWPWVEKIPLQVIFT